MLFLKIQPEVQDRPPPFASTILAFKEQRVNRDIWYFIFLHRPLRHRNSPLPCVFDTLGKRSHHANAAYDLGNPPEHRHGHRHFVRGNCGSLHVVGAWKVWPQLLWMVGDFRRTACRCHCWACVELLVDELQFRT
jgi:hypothetical protein